MSLGLQTVSSFERCPIFRVSHIERVYCTRQGHTQPPWYTSTIHTFDQHTQVCAKKHALHVLSTLSSAFASFSLSLLLSSFLSCFASLLRSSLEGDGARRLVCVPIFPLNRCATVTDTIVGRVTCLNSDYNPLASVEHIA